AGADLPAEAFEAPEERAGDRSRAAFRDAEAAARREDREHEADDRAHRIVGTDVGVEREAGDDPTRGLGLEGRLGESATAGERDPRETEQVDRPEARHRPDRGERREERAEKIIARRRVPGRDPPPRVTVLSEGFGRAIEVAGDGGAGAVGRR